MPRTNLQKQNDFEGQNFYVGLDVHKKSWAVTIRSLGIQVGHFTQSPDADALYDYLKRNFPGGIYHSAYEAGFCGTYAHERLCSLGIRNILVHAADIPITDKQKKNKTDLRDSRAIAENLERGNLEAIHVLTREEQELRSLFRLRERKVADVVRSNNKLKSFLMFHSIVVPETVSKTDFLSGKVLNWLAIELCSRAATLALQQYIADLKYQRDQLFIVTRLLRTEVLTFHKQAYENLLSIPGIGSITAMGLVTELSSFNRFVDPDKYASYLGLCPWEDSSGDDVQTKGVQPRCNKHLRHLLVEASWKAISKSRSLFAYYSKHAVGKNGKKAIIKVARKLAMIARGVVLSGKPYLEDYQKQKQQQYEKLKAERFSSGMPKQHHKQPGKKQLVASVPG